MPTIIGGRVSPTMKPGASKHLSGVFADDYSRSTNIGTEYRRNPGNGSNKDAYELAHGKQFEVIKGVGSRVNPCKTISGNTSFVTVGDPYDKLGNKDSYELAHGKQFSTAPPGGGYTGTIDNAISPAKYNAVGDPYKGSASETLKVARGRGKGFEVPAAGPSKVNLDKTIGGHTGFVTVGDEYDKLGNKDSYPLAHGKQFLGGATKSANRAVGADQDAVFEARFMQLFSGEKYRDEHKQDYTDYRVCQRLTETVKKDRRVMERTLEPQYVAAQGLPTLSISRNVYQPLVSPEKQREDERQRAKLLKKYPKLAKEMERDRLNRSPTRQLAYIGPEQGPQLLGRCTHGPDLNYAPLEVSERSPSPR